MTVVRITVVAGLLATIASTLSVYPHQLAYFNELSGGPANGHRHMLHSSLDWGQDLLYLADWAAANRVFVAKISGRYDPAYIEKVIRPRMPTEQAAARKVNVASANDVFARQAGLRPTGERVAWTLWIVE